MIVGIPIVDGDDERFVDADGEVIVVRGGTGVATPRLASVADEYAVDLLSGGIKVAEAPAATFAGVLRPLSAGEWRCEGAVAALDASSSFDLDLVDAARVVRGRDSRVMFSGFVAPVEEGVGGLEVNDAEDGLRFVLGGPDAWFPLTVRRAFPDPASEPPWAVGHDERSGVASTVAAGYVTANVAAGALPSRVWPGLAVTDGSTGSSGSWSARLERLDLLVARVCTDGGIVCRPTVALDGSVDVCLCNRADRSTRLVLSDQGDLVEFQRRRVPASNTYVVAGGQGDLTDRLFRVASSGATGAERVETFADWSTLASSSEVAQAAASTLERGVASWWIAAELSTVTAQRLRLFDDYDVGDIVAVEIDSVRYAVPIEAVKIELSAGQQVVRPLLGTAASTALSGLLRKVNALSNSFDSRIS